MVRAEGKFRGQPITATVINPGAGGIVWLATIDDSFFPEHFVVEAKCVDAAMDELAESEHGAALLVTPDGPECHDYGFTYAGTDDGARKQYSDLGEIPPGAKFTITIGGKLLVHGVHGEANYVKEPTISGNGTYYDSDNLLITGDEAAGWACRYFSEELPKDGCLPQDYIREQAKFYLGDDVDDLMQEV